MIPLVSGHTGFVRRSPQTSGVDCGEHRPRARQRSRPRWLRRGSGCRDPRPRQHRRHALHGAADAADRNAGHERGGAGGARHPGQPHRGDDAARGLPFARAGGIGLQGRPKKQDAGCRTCSDRHLEGTAPLHQAAADSVAIRRRTPTVSGANRRTLNSSRLSTWTRCPRATCRPRLPAPCRRCRRAWP